MHVKTYAEVIRASNESCLLFKNSAVVFAGKLSQIFQYQEVVFDWLFINQRIFLIQLGCFELPFF